MAAASIEVSGPRAERLAGELQAALVDGSQTDLSGMDQKELEIAFVRRTPSGH